MPDVSKSTKAVPTDEPPFEEALKKLESIVEAMESEDLSLEQLLLKYEEGSRLARLCQTRLADAELKIQKLEESLAGELSAQAFSPVAEAAHD
ncbi:MAG: exodeoxyribonuclease VII small subunit [Pedosphaera sp.]|nr:exodeoxyribonuclease VII small subunit [Pedosphaera sp.]